MTDINRDTFKNEKSIYSPVRKYVIAKSLGVIFQLKKTSQGGTSFLIEQPRNQVDHMVIYIYIINIAFTVLRCKFFCCFNAPHGSS